MNKTLYLRHGEEFLYNKAKTIAELTGTNLSAVIMKLLKEWVETQTIEGVTASVTEHIKNVMGKP